MLFSGVIALMLDQGITKGRKQLLIKLIQDKGVGKTLKHKRLLEILSLDCIPSSVVVVNVDWISSCIVAGQLIDCKPYYIISNESSTKCTTSVNETSPSKSSKSSKPSTSSQLTISSPNKESIPLKRKIDIDSDSDYIESDDDTAEGGVAILPTKETLIKQGLVRPAPKKGRWMCQIPSTELQSRVNHNKIVTDKLEELLLEYKNSSMPKDRWRANSLTKAISAIKRHPNEITSYEEARGIAFVGDRVADKIWEIISSGHLRRLDYVDKVKQNVIDLFKAVHGIGQVLAEQYYAQGYRTLQDLLDANILNRQQLIGIKYYEEFKDRMDRSEVKEIEDKVREGCHKINSSLEVVTCGSYRRGKPTCGDVDILITHPDGRSHKGIFTPLITLLKNDNFLTDDLTVHEDVNDGNCKYFGVCILPGEKRKHRRIDIYICPYSEYPLMLLHFTGSGHFNRSIRHKADKMGMSLSEHSLNVGVIRKNGVKVCEGTPLPVFSEADVFKYLEVDYLEPHDRDLD